MRIAWSYQGLIAATILLTGCAGGAKSVKNGGASPETADASPPRAVIRECKLEVALQPELHRIEATAALMVVGHSEARTKDSQKLRLQLHRSLGIDSMTCDGQVLAFRRCLPPRDAPGSAAPPSSQPTTSPSETDADAPNHYEVDWQPPEGPGGTLVVRYGGQLQQDIAAGEIPGQVHNFEMRAHIGEEGIYLGEGGDWYPRLSESAGRTRREAPLTQFELTVTEVPGMVLVASGNRRDAAMDAPRGPRTTWRSPFPLQGLALVGGAHEVHQRQVGNVLVSAHLLKAHAGFAPAILGAAASYLKLYQPLIGAYPYSEFTVVENFFSSGFAFPGFTVLASGVIERGGLLLRPGLLDHELMHNWWGNGVFVSSTSGNWCEALTAYCTNYMRHVLENRADEARAKRRNTCHLLSRLAPDDDKPLSQFGLPNGPDRLIGYDKGAMVFAMLADRVGQETLWRSLKRLFLEKRGKPTTWTDIRAAVERQSGKSLDGFFKDWVYSSGLPNLVFKEAQYDARAQRVSLTILQKGDRFFDLDLPVRLVYETGSHQETVRVNRGAQVPVLPSRRAPLYIEVDPDYRIMRKVLPTLTIPSVSGIEPTKPLLVVRPDTGGDAFEPFVTRILARYKGEKDAVVREMSASSLTAEDLAAGHVLLVGEACRSPVVQDRLKGTLVTFGETSFSVDGTVYAEPGHEVLCCLRNDQDPGGVLCFYYGNDVALLKKARVLTFYGSNSIVVFKDGEVVLRKDLEVAERISVETLS